MVESCAPTSAAAAANEFLELGWNDEDRVPPIDPLKLQKLLFYANAWYLAYNGVPLFDEDFEAWPWGPVVRDIYAETSQYGRKPVAELVSELTVETAGQHLKTRFHTPRIENEEVREFIRSVWDSHKQYTGIQLSNSTHAEGEPWNIIKERYGSLDQKPTIPPKLIAEVFKAKLADASGDSTIEDASEAEGHSPA
ncbi:MAG: Panacea domain-containing protein [Methyloligella sp. ZOD6]